MKKNALKILILSFFIIQLCNAQEKIPIDIISTGHVVVKAKVNGVVGKFIFDTGAGMTFLTKKYSDKLPGVKNLKRNYIGFRATSERVDMGLYQVDKISVGSFSKKNEDVGIMDIDLFGYDGLISLNFFEDKAVTIDYKNKELILETAASLAFKKSIGNVISLQLKEDRDISTEIFAFFVLNKKDTLLFSIDSGAGQGNFKINSKYRSDCDVDTTKMHRFEHQSEFNSSLKDQFQSANVPALCLKDCPGISINNFKSIFYPTLIYDGIVSTNWLGSAISFDLKNKEMIIQK